MPDLTPLVFTVPLATMTVGLLVNRINALMGSMSSNDPNSTTSRKIGAYQKELSRRGETQVGRNNAPFSGNKGRSARDDR